MVIRTGVPEFSLDLRGVSHAQGFRPSWENQQPADTFRMPVDLRIDTEGNPELKTVERDRYGIGIHGRNVWRPAGWDQGRSHNVILKAAFRCARARQ